MLRALSLAIVFLVARSSVAAEPESWRLEAGPALTGDGVVWAESSGTTLRVRTARANGATRTLYRGDPPSDEYSWSVAALAASPARIALLRRSTFCRRGDPTTVFPCLHARQILVGGGRRPLRVLATTGTCLWFSPLNEESVDVVGKTILAIESYCPGEQGPVRRRLVRYNPAGRVVLRDEPMSPSACCSGVRAAGRFVVWSSDSLVLLYDLRKRRVVEQLEIGHGFVQAVAVQEDGKLAVLIRRARSAADSLQLQWFDSGHKTPHTFPISVPASGLVDLELRADTIIVARRLGQGSELAMFDLRGRVRGLARFGGRFRRAGEFDFDGARVTWATERLTSSRLDCPPPGRRVPCFWRDSGIRSIWLAERRTRPLRPKLVAREQFHDLHRVAD